MDHALRSSVDHGRILAIGVIMLGAANISLAQSVCEVAHLSASDGTPDDTFGYAVAVSGDSALVGAIGRRPPGRSGPAASCPEGNAAFTIPLQ